jgi:hypothetical protein
VGWDPGAASDVDSRISAARLRTEAWTVVEARRFSAASRGANAGALALVAPLGLKAEGVDRERSPIGPLFHRPHTHTPGWAPAGPDDNT